MCMRSNRSEKPVRACKLCSLSLWTFIDQLTCRLLRRSRLFPVACTYSSQSRMQVVASRFRPLTGSRSHPWSVNWGRIHPSNHWLLKMTISSSLRPTSRSRITTSSLIIDRRPQLLWKKLPQQSLCTVQAGGSILLSSLHLHPRRLHWWI